VVYSRAAKEALGVAPEIIDRYGTIAVETTQALAKAARDYAHADVAIATTGVAGPGSSEEKPEGTLYMVADIKGHQVCQETRYSTTRSEYKRRGALEALYLLWRELR